jgi:hypothetical protein
MALDLDSIRAKFEFGYETWVQRDVGDLIAEVERLRGACEGAIEYSGIGDWIAAEAMLREALAGAADEPEGRAT